MEEKLKQGMLGRNGHQGGFIRVLVVVGLGDSIIHMVYIYGEISSYTGRGKIQGKPQLIDPFLGILDNHTDH